MTRSLSTLGKEQHQQHADPNHLELELQKMPCLPLTSMGTYAHVPYPHTDMEIKSKSWSDFI